MLEVSWKFELVTAMYERSEFLTYKRYNFNAPSLTSIILMDVLSVSTFLGKCIITGLLKFLQSLPNFCGLPVKPSLVKRCS